MEVLKYLHKKHEISNIGFNVDYSPYAKKRDDAIKKWAKKENITIINIYDNYTWDNTLNNLGEIWNVYDSDNNLHLSTEIRTKGDYIWLGTKTKNRLNLPTDIVYIGKINKLSKI